MYGRYVAEDFFPRTQLILDERKVYKLYDSASNFTIHSIINPLFMLLQRPSTAVKDFLAEVLPDTHNCPVDKPGMSDCPIWIKMRTILKYRHTIVGDPSAFLRIAQG